MPPALEAFEIAAPEEALQDLALRLRAARLPCDSADEWDAGISPVYLREVVTYWLDRFDWRAQERLLNRFRQFRVEIDGTRLR
jgi:microsomal epoxide hydrolase